MGEITMTEMLATVTGRLLPWMRRTPAVATAARRAEPSAATPRAMAPVVNPRLAGRPEGALWVLRASPRCEFAAALDGRRYTTADAIALPLPGCGLHCQCRYEPVADRRRGPRRGGEDRRAALRFEQRADRRHGRTDRRADRWGRDAR